MYQRRDSYIALCIRDMTRATFFMKDAFLIAVLDFDPIVIFPGINHKVLGASMCISNILEVKIPRQRTRVRMLIQDTLARVARHDLKERPHLGQALY